MRRINLLMRRLKSQKKLIILGVLLVLILCGIFYWLSYLASIHVARIFNEVAATQHLLEGHITVETLSANPSGRVSFTGLKWTNPRGEVLADIPDGNFKVKPFDVVTKRMSSSSITYLEIHDATLFFDFDDRMNLQHIDAMKPVKRGRGNTKLPKELKDFDAELIATNCTVAAKYKQRTFNMTSVYIKSTLKNKKMYLDFKSGKFCGTIEADGLSILGSVDLSKDEGMYDDVNLTIDQCNPSSLGAGINVKEKVSAKARINGLLEAPVIEGFLTMDQLNIPALHFTKVKGNFHYEDGLITSDKITAKVYGGDVLAKGKFDIDDKSYELHILGDKLHSNMAAHQAWFKCLVKLNLHMISDGNPKTVLTYGNFTSGHGFYGPIKFDKISGEFSNQNKLLRFSNVVIESSDNNISAPNFQINKGRLKMDSLYYLDRRTGIKKRII
ncbi:MAG: hypothetical protein PHQ45_04155 [Acidaminococcaceae bacterium]|nr:hypothetical protein [Acidaminococcaceae bacterium]